MGLVVKQGWYYWVKRVPKRYAGKVLSQEGKPLQQVRQALHTKDKLVAQMKAARIEIEKVGEWEARLAGRDENARRHFEVAKALAEIRGFEYRGMDDLLGRKVEDILPRAVEATAPEGKSVSVEVTDALLGTVTESHPTLLGVFEEYLTLTKTRHLKKSQAQKHKWETPRRRAVNTFEAVVSAGRPAPPSVDQITRADILKYRDMWSKRIEAGTHKAGTANKEFGHLSEVYSTWAEIAGSSIRNPFKGIRLDGEEKSQRATFSRDWIKNKILAEGALDTLNEEARDVLLVMINTGLRPSEVTDAPLGDYRVHENIPHLIVAPHGRELKVAHTMREIPLVGVSLEAARRIVQRGGIRRYANNASSWSALVNKYLGNNGLKESPGHTAYSIRHYIEDALLMAGVDDRVRADILGHKYQRPIYGEGGGLPARLAALERIAL